MPQVRVLPGAPLHMLLRGMLVGVILLVPTVLSARVSGLFASKAVSVGFGASSTSSDGSVHVSVIETDDAAIDGFPAILRVEAGSHVQERRFSFGLNAQVMWNSSGTRVALTGSEGGAVGQFQTAAVRIRDNQLEWFDLTRLIERALGQPVTCGSPEAPNVGAITWISDHKLLVAAEIMPHSNCDSMGTFAAYEVDVTARRLDLDTGNWR
jgi:hypothetical protein